MSTKQILAVVAVAVLIFSLLTMGKLWENVDAGEYVVIQSPFSGDLNVKKTPGMTWQGWGKATHYRKSNQFSFSLTKENDQSITVKWNDGGHATISGSARYDLPNDDVQIINLHQKFGSQEAIDAQLIKTNIEKAIYMTGPLMTSKESYAERRNDIISYVEDQASRGVYRTEQIQVKETDPITNTERNVTKVRIIMDASGIPLRQEASPVGSNGIKLYNLSINGIAYDKNVEEQIATQQKATMAVTTAIAKAKEAEQRALTVEKEGEANAAQAKWDQEVIKAKLVTEAESRKKVAELDVQTAGLEKTKAILEGEGEASKKRLVMQANGALEQKLAAWLESQKYWSEAFGQYQGNMVPLYQTGGANGSGANALNFMEIMSANAMKQLSLDMSNKK